MSYTDQDFEQTAAPHTPGPWKVETYRDGRVSVLGFVKADSALVVADLLNGNRYHREDARLIAAAPDLLAALQTAFNHISASGGNPYLTEPGRTIAAAIAKATGQ